jgi:hypothetical protein
MMSLAGASGLVLCAGDGGHVAVESAFAEACCAAHGAPREAAHLEPVADACECTDTPLLAAAVRAQTLLETSSSPAAFLVAPPPAVAPRARSAGAGVLIPAASARIALRSIVLLV